MDPKIDDYLTKQLFIEKNVVTFRSLSRQFNMHVNIAKNTLAKFHASSKVSTPCCATYLLTGEVPYIPRKLTENGDEMEIDGGDATPTIEDDEADDEVSLTKVALVPESELSKVETQFLRIFSKHVYSLSDSPLVDAGLICSPSENVYKTDASVPHSESVMLGTITGPHVRVGKPVPVASTSKCPTQESSSKGKSKDEPLKPKDEPKQDAESKPAAEKPKRSGTLDWSKAKVKGQSDKATKEKEAKTPPKPQAEPKPKAEPEAKVEPKSKPKPIPKPKMEEEESSAAEENRKEGIGKGTNADGSMKIGPPKRGTKRKSGIPSAMDSEFEDIKGPTPATKQFSVNGKAKSKRTIVDSDSEDELPQPRMKRKTVPPSLLAIMDIDDDEVVKASQSQVEEPPITDAEMSTNDDINVDMDTDEAEEQPVKIKTKRKVKKTIPKGSNGRPKKRIVQSQTKIDDKGYTVTEDVSSYETDNDDTPEAESQDKPKAKAGAKKPAKSSSESQDASAGKNASTDNSKPKKSSGKSAGQGSLMAFFGKQK